MRLCFGKNYIYWCGGLEKAKPGGAKYCATSQTKQIFTFTPNLILRERILFFSFSSATFCERTLVGRVSQKDSRVLSFVWRKKFNSHWWKLSGKHITITEELEKHIIALHTAISNSLKNLAPKELRYLSEGEKKLFRLCAKLPPCEGRSWLQVYYFRSSRDKGTWKTNQGPFGSMTKTSCRSMYLNNGNWTKAIHFLKKRTSQNGHTQ